MKQKPVPDEGMHSEQRTEIMTYGSRPILYIPPNKVGTVEVVLLFLHQSYFS